METFVKDCVPSKAPYLVVADSNEVLDMPKSFVILENDVLCECI